MKIKLITPDARNAAAWVAALRTEPASDVNLVERSLRDVNVLVNGSHPDMVLVETTTPQDFEALEKLASAHPEIDYVLVGNDLSPEFLMRAMRAVVVKLAHLPRLQVGGHAQIHAGHVLLHEFVALRHAERHQRRRGRLPRVRGFGAVRGLGLLGT